MLACVIISDHSKHTATLFKPLLQRLQSKCSIDSTQYLNIKLKRKKNKTDTRARRLLALKLAKNEKERERERDHVSKQGYAHLSTHKKAIFRRLTD